MTFEEEKSLFGYSFPTADQYLECNHHRINVTLFRKLLLEWGREHFRDFPWRSERDPYAVLMAEVMLHRTQANQVLPVYLKWMETFPYLESLSGVSREAIRDCLAPLGLNWRIDLIYDMILELKGRYNGQIPRKKKDLLFLPGISEYVAGALRCFAWSIPVALIDTNTVRIVGRVFGLEIKDSSRRNKTFREVHQALLDKENPAEYNFALLDLGGRLCRNKKKSECDPCPLNSFCKMRMGSVGI